MWFNSSGCPLGGGKSFKCVPWVASMVLDIRDDDDDEAEASSFEQVDTEDSSNCSSRPVSKLSYSVRTCDNVVSSSAIGVPSWFIAEGEDKDASINDDDDDKEDITGFGDGEPMPAGMECVAEDEGGAGCGYSAFGTHVDWE
mmetsp:Transcript_47081/g.54994  ORF Transcript_47081/g.54994 Transcript_47081/m.54994 type:complete len:142 (+) Transcript_47081:499-924(+)